MLTAVAINFANVVARYAFSAPIFWAEEAMVFLQVWCVLIGAGLITQAHGHLRLGAVEALAPAKVRRTLEVAAMALMVAIAALVAFISARVVLGMIASDQRSVALELPMALPYAALPVGFSLIALLALVRLWQLLRGGPSAPEG
jgi:TRAP-type C4-dicarboxylate transport system permease small subunit